MNERPARLNTKDLVAFLGGGNMAEALLKGLLSSKLVPARHITVSDVKKERLADLKRTYGIVPAATNAAAVEGATIIFLAVKPQQIEELLREIGGAVRPGQLVISIAAGITTRFIERSLRPGVAVVRSMPNTPALLGAGAVAVAKGKTATAKDLARASALFSASGIVVDVPEKRIDAVTALSGSGPAYVFLVAEIMAKAGAAMGIPRPVAEKLARQTVYGAGLMLRDVQAGADELRRRVTSPGGTTEAAVAYLESNDFQDIFEGAIRRARKRAGELSR